MSGGYVLVMFVAGLIGLYGAASLFGPWSWFYRPDRDIGIACLAVAGAMLVALVAQAGWGR